MSSKLNIFCSVKRMKRQAKNGAKRAMSHVSDHRLLSRIYTELSNPTVKTQRIQLEYVKIFHQRGRTDIKQIYEKIFNTTGH